ncbi:SCO family protein [Paracidovorax konjaci]
MKFNLLISRQRRRFIEGGMALATLFLSACTDTLSSKTSKFDSIDITSADYAKDFFLTDQDGQTRSLQDFRGKIVVVFFGFTQCPDVCPTTMAELSEVRQVLGQDASKLQTILITVDPERDTLPVLKAYMANFDPSFVALRPTLEQLKTVATDFKIYYKKVGDSKTAYSVDHTAGTYIFDAQGRIRLFGRYGSGAQVLAGDIRRLLEGA